MRLRGPGAGLRVGVAAGFGISALTLALPVTVATPAYAAGDSCDAVTAPDTVPVDRPDPSEPVADLRIDEAHDLVRAAGHGPGAGVVVAVVDGGIAPGVLPRVVAGPRISTGGSPPEWFGTAVAGLVAGSPDGDRTVGIAPEATLVDVRVYDSLTPDDGEDGISPDAVAAGLQALAERQTQLRTDIVVVPRAVSRSDALDAAVDALARNDVVVVAASGDRPDEESDPLYAQYGPGAGAGADTGSTGGSTASGEPDATGGSGAGEDAARDAWPAGYDLPTVVAAATTVPDGTDPTSVVLQSSAIDVAAPTSGAVSYGVNGAPCQVPGPSTGWAAAEVAGVLALLQSAYPEDTGAQSVARLYESATGGREVTANNVLTGHGIIQPVEALQRPLRPDESGDVTRSRVRDRDNVPADVPEREADVLAGTRTHALWWGLLGGGALLVALVLRPVLARRR